MAIPFQRQIFVDLAARLREPRRFMQVILGPRQTGKTTGVLETLRTLRRPTHFVNVDEQIAPPSVEWIRSEWARARELARGGPAVLALDEIQKVADWSGAVKGQWDLDARNDVPLHVVLLGSSTLLIHGGLSESMAGRFEVLRAMHWTLSEMREAFGFDVDHHVYFGGYPGGASRIDDHVRWRDYVRESIIETTISRDVLMMTRVDKPALLRALFHLACSYAGQTLSYTKMLGQLQDAGNTATLSHYLELLARAGLVVGLTKYAGEVVRQRGSSPKLLPLNTALVSALSRHSFDEARADPEYWGRLVETAVGAHLFNSAIGSLVELSWWREGNREVDYVLHSGRDITLIEVKTGAKSPRFDAFRAFEKSFGKCRMLVVGTEGIPLDEFMSQPAEHWLG